MRGVIAGLLLMSFSFAHAELKSVEDFYKESEQQIKKTNSEKATSQKSNYLLELEKSFKTTP